MLVLSRRLSEKILLPSINVSVQVVAIRPGQVRLGIDAPPEVQVLRAETADSYARNAPAEPGVRVDEVRGIVADHLKAADAGVMLLRRQLHAGLIDDAYATLDRLHQEFARALQEPTERTAAPMTLLAPSV